MRVLKIVLAIIGFAILGAIFKMVIEFVDVYLGVEFKECVPRYCIKIHDLMYMGYGVFAAYCFIKVSHLASE
jgi:hypothetical protein